ncbi:hypothetical protein [Pyxidicoccus xibeiensis]|uniref:hypothetical protein n=1 Tax=Pyxidicoccus xibeiensis TaxID=2906759 RepID=UPI0020A7CE02|nr:hypothetical protein [Pyxidicoccus xibeiensis]MCP3143147.1 hypothetical protein [Pyxidicoccus xibeiensis]
MTRKSLNPVMSHFGALGASALLLFTGCGGEDLRCGEGTTRQDDACVVTTVEPPPDPDAESALTITSLSVPAQGPVYVNHKLKARLGIKGKGSGGHFTVSLGLMEAPPATGDIPSALSNCLLKGEHVYVPGDEKERLIDLDFTVGADCKPGSHHNFFVAYSADTASTASQMVVFSARDIQGAENQQCRKADGSVGCVYELDLRESPGLDLEVVQVVPSTRVAVLYPAAGSGRAHPLLAVGTEVALHGRERDASAAIPGEVVHLTYSLAPHGGDANDWQPLAFDEQRTPRHAITRLLPHEPLHASHHLYATQAVLERLQGAWAREHVFNLRVCAEGSFTQSGNPHLAGSDGTANDCRTIAIQLVRASSGATREASTQAWNYSWSQTYGGSNLSITPSFNTINVVDLTGTQLPQAGGQPQQGAMASVNGQANLGGSYVGSLGSTPLFQGSAQAVAYVAVNNSFVDVSVNAFGVNLYGFNRTANIPNPIYDQDWNVMKQACESDTLVVVAIPVTLQFCGSGTIGLQAQLNIGNGGVAGQTGQGGQVQGIAKPYANLSASASASVGLPGASVGVQGNLTLLDAKAPLNTTLDWGLTNLSPLAMDLTGKATWELDLDTLSGDISLVATYPTVNWCSKWHIPYPCGPWSGTYTDPLYSFQGLSWNYSLLAIDQSQSLSL